MLKRGNLFIFEGPDGVGKTTLSKRLADVLAATLHPVKWMSFPGREPGTLGSAVYSIHHTPHAFGIEVLSPAARQTLHIAAHLDAIEHTIKPLLASGTHVVLDRFWWSTWVYGLVDNLNRPFLEALIEVERQFWGATLPNCVLLVVSDAPRDRAEESISRFQALTSSYQMLTASEGAKYPVEIINNNGSIEEAVADIQEALRIIA